MRPAARCPGPGERSLAPRKPQAQCLQHPRSLPGRQPPPPRPAACARCGGAPPPLERRRVAAHAARHAAEEGGGSPSAKEAPQSGQLNSDGDAGDDGEGQSSGVRAALGALRFYKSAISPLLPPACRFLPTCSEYSMDAYRRYGVARGTVLTAWRLARCSPLGAWGRFQGEYDPVRWPPPGLEALFPGGGG